MLKAADALHEAGYSVRVVSANYTPWAERGDRDARAHRRWSWSLVDYRRESAPWMYWKSGVRFHLAQQVSEAVGARRAPWYVVTSAFSRAGHELVRAALAEPTDFYYGGTTGALASVAGAAARAGVPYGIDFEDLHSAEHADTTASGRLANTLAARIEERLIGQAVFVTTSSGPIADRYRELYGVRPLVVHNTFPLPGRAPSAEQNTDAPLKLYWFSQTIGPGRGLEDVVAAAGLGGLPCELHLRGHVADAYRSALSAAAAATAPRLTMTFHEPVPPDAMVDSCRPYDIGLSIEGVRPPNRALCLTNKALAYPLAGLPVIVTDTPGHRSFVSDLGSGGMMYLAGDVGALAAILCRWHADRDLLARAKADAWAAAKRRWHWEHPDERGTLIDAMVRSTCASRA